MLVGTKLNSLGLLGKKMVSDRQQWRTPGGFCCSTEVLLFLLAIVPSSEPLTSLLGNTVGEIFAAVQKWH